MIQILLVSMLFAIPGALLIAFNDINPLLELESRSRKAAISSRDRTNIHARLEELGRGSERDYQNFRIRQFGYCASGAVLVMVLLLMTGKSLVFTFFFSVIKKLPISN